ncbi:uncharacterized protein CLUP02_11541 [Colletotrichum lupini]|uniref:Xylanolytic transcriptional activator regulatory domain-containing protein n=1 Tax=Colletotrichum lupini TaxID=145971 RepID=A0A9Q8T0L9_9PEZI|nr:uncharacterized protein CLUP02_11541 [Colletotrichum lupini]UQC86042.1 hypothetical protein CLUP02_11541 [Colletotrichum lupini]
MEAVLNQAGLPRPGAPPTRISPSETDAASVSVFAGPAIPNSTVPITNHRLDAPQAAASHVPSDHPMGDEAVLSAPDSRSSQTPVPQPREIPEPPSQLSGKMPVFAVIASRMREVNSASYCSTFNRQVFTPRLEREEAITILMPLYDDVISNYPLLNFHYFVRHFETLPEADDTFNSTSGWAYMNAVISVGTRWKTINSAFQEVCQLAWPFFKNAFSVLTELIVKGGDLLSVQAIVAMAVFMQGTTCTRTATLLSSAAVRLSQNIGLHRQPCTMMSMCAQDVEARSRVFWAAYILDKETGLNHGLDSIQDDDDIETELPSGWGEGVDILNLRAKLAMVESSIRRRLYTAKGLRLTDADLVKAIIDLDALLEEWRSNLCITLLTDVLETPGSARARGDLAATRNFAHFLQKFEKSEGCDLKRVLTACAMMQRTAQYAVDDAQNIMRAQNLVGNNGGGVPLIPGFSLGEDAQVLQSLLGTATHPMYLVQGLMGNLPNRDQNLTMRLAQLLGTPFESGKPGSPLGSQPLQPETYGFGFGQGQAGNDPTANWS